MIAEINESGYIIDNNYINPTLVFYCEESYEIISDSNDNVKKDWHNCMIDKPFFLLDNSKLVEIIVPCSPRFEVFYIHQRSAYFFFDNYFEAINFLEENNIEADENQINRFHSKMTCEPGKTFHRFINRLIPGSRYFIDNGVFLYESYMPIHDLNLSYVDFKRRFEACIKFTIADKDIGVLLSGGVDSTAVALAASKFSRSLKTYTMKYIPLQSGTESDAVIAGISSANNNWIHQITEVNFEVPQDGLIEYYSKEIPLVCGLPHGYEALLKSMNSDNIEKALTGQNADLLTFFGATSDISLSREGVVSFIRRLFLSKYYCLFLDSKTFSLDKLIGALIYFFGFFITIIFSIVKKQKFRQPRNISELFLFSISSPDSIPFVSMNFSQNCEEDSFSLHPTDLNSENFHFNLLRYRLGSDMMLADSQLIKVAGKKNHVFVEFPFSFNPLVYFFMNRKLSLKSILKPKSFVYDYVFENYPNYSKKIKTTASSNSFEPHVWAKKLMDNGFVPMHDDGIVRTKFGELYFNLSKVWIRSLK